MQLRHIKTVIPATDGMCKVTAVAWSANNRRLAVVSVDRVVHLFDAMTFEKKDKFSTKAAEKGEKTYVVRGLVFSPDSTKLAVAQSDNIVFLYKLGLEWGDKKSICNKFSQSSSVTCITWPNGHPNDVVFGIAEGKIKVGQLRTNKTATLYTTTSYVCAICSSPDGNGILSSHLDGSIYRFSFDDMNGRSGATKIVSHSSVPYALAWGESILAAGNDRLVVFYNSNGKIEKSFDYSNDDELSEFTTAAVNPTGETIVVGNQNSFFTYNYISNARQWEEVSVKKIENLYSVTCLSWKVDGSRLAVGSLCGALDVYDACVRRYRYKGKFEFTYVSPSQIIVKRLSSGERVVIRSQFGFEITKINIFQERYLVANTKETLLVGDLQTSKLSEVPWQSTEKEKYIFDNETVCTVFQAGELSLIEYGQSEILGSVRTEHMSAHLLSVRINERPLRNSKGVLLEDQNNKKIGYLLDLQTICIKDLYTHVSTTVNHDCRIDWLELNSRGNNLLFRDKNRQLHLFDIETQIRTTLLLFCNYVQWVPDSDVVVAQNRNNLHVWYNIRSPDQATIYQIKGDVEQIERSGGKTEVVVDEGMNTASYELDESLIAFGTALDDSDLKKAVSILEPLELSPETEAMWSQLSQEALSNNDHRVAERCSAALGDVSCCRFLRKVNKTARLASSTLEDGSYHWKVRAKLHQLRKDLRGAEDIYISQGQTQEAIEMYQVLHQWEEAIRVAESKNHPETAAMRRNFYDYLLESRQEEKAGILKEKEGDYITAINLYLKGGFPARAAQLISQSHSNHQQNLHQPHLLETVANALSAAGMHEKAGDFFEKMDQHKRALEAYIKAGAYRQAVDLARREYPREVIRLEEAWGDHLVSLKQVDMAINHYIEANIQTKAVEAALHSRQWAKAGQLVENLDGETARPYYRRLARHYQEAQCYEAAERCFVKADSPQDAVEMYTKINKWESAHNVAISYMSETEVNMLYVSQAQRMEGMQKLKEAEKLYLTVNEPDLAINMYKKQRKYDQMIRLVTKYRKDLLKETHMHLAQQLEVEGQVKDAEHHYSEAGEWQTAVNMYRSNDMWDEAIRVAKYHGGINASKRVAYAWAMTLGGEAGSKLLSRLGLIEPAIDYAIESGAFDHAYELARTCASKKLPEVHLKHALYLEDEERFAEAEEEFIRAGKPKEAVDMYVHQHDWVSAMRVAENSDPASVSDIFLAQGRLCVEKKDYKGAEGLFINASKPELALAAYQEANMWSDAMRLAKRHLPHKINEVNMLHQRFITSSHGNEGPNTQEELVAAARMWENSKQYAQAIDAYLEITTDHINNPQVLEEIWENAIKLAASHQRTRYNMIVEEVAQRLCDIRRYDSAAKLFEDIDQIHEAVNCYIRGENWVKARNLCQQQAPEWLPKVEKAFHSSTGDFHKVVEDENSEDSKRGSGFVEKIPSNSIDMFVQRGDWESVFELASREGTSILGKYVALRCRRFCDMNEVENALDLLLKYNSPVNEMIFPVVKSLANTILSRDAPSEKQLDHISSVRKINQVLFKLMSNLKIEKESIPLPKELDHLLLASHYVALQTHAIEKGLLDIVAKLSMSLLRYITILPADKMFYKAGMACKVIKSVSSAFVFLNRYLDLSEAIEEGSATLLDNSDFLGTDIPPPTTFELPKQQYLTDDVTRDDIRDWILALSMDQKVQEKLQEIKCFKCNVSIYEGTLECSHCRKVFEACIITGFPVHSNKAVHCTTCHCVADREAWNKWITHFNACAWCGATQKPFY